MSERLYGGVKSHALGRLMRDCVRKVIEKGRGMQRFDLEFNEKSGDQGQDYFSGLDTAAQDIYQNMVSECLVGVGFVAEEGEVRDIPDGDDVLVITADGIDGTNALKRQQSEGIGTMVAAVLNNEIVAAYVGDICTGEIYGYHPDSSRVSRIIESMRAIRLDIDVERNLTEQHVLFRDHPHLYSNTCATMSLPHQRGGIGSGLTCVGGSIGIWLARLWKGEVGCAITRPGMSMPWDLCPILGISRRLGIKPRFVSHGQIHEYGCSDLLSRHSCSTELIYVHESRVDELQLWLDEFNE